MGKRTKGQTNEVTLALEEACKEAQYEEAQIGAEEKSAEEEKPEKKKKKKRAKKSDVPTKENRKVSSGKMGRPFASETEGKKALFRSTMYQANLDYLSEVARERDTSRSAALDELLTELRTKKRARK